MINNFMTDEITVVRRSFDDNGVPTDTSTPGVKARVEDYNKMLRNVDGQEVIGNQLIMVDDSIDINYEDLIKITKNILA